MLGTLKGSSQDQTALHCQACPPSSVVFLLISFLFLAQALDPARIMSPYWDGSKEQFLRRILLAYEANLGVFGC